MKIRYRQPIFLKDKFNYWHYWGFIDNMFIGPIHGTLGITLKKAEKTSQQYSNRKDKKGRRLYAGDLIYITGTQTNNSMLEIKQKDGKFNIPNLTTYESIPDCMGGRETTYPDEHTIEKIGNIYQTPKLAKKIRNQNK